MILRVISENENLTEIRHIKTKVLYGKSAECNLGYYMYLSKETQERYKYKVYVYDEK